MADDKLAIRVILSFFWKKGLSAGAAAKEINDVEVPGSVNERTAQHWFKRFKEGDTTFEEKPRSVVDDEVFSEGKEHILTADTHRAMMTWALAIQTKRDAWDKMVTLGTKPEELKLTYTDAQQKALRSTDAPSTHLGRKGSLQLNGGAQKALRKMVAVSWEKRRNSTFADIGLLRHSESTKDEPETQKPLSSSVSPQRTPSPYAPIHEEEEDDAQKESSPETESASESDRLAAEHQEDDEEEAETTFLRLEADRSVKCELAKCLNRENSCKLALEAKEAQFEKLKERCSGGRREIEQLKQQLEMLSNRNRFLNDEIGKLSRMLQQEQFRSHSKQLHLHELGGEVDQLKRDYVFLLQSCIRITCTEGPETTELYMYGEKRHKQRVFALLEEARKVDPSLPSLEGMTNSLCHVDSLGFKHLFVDKHLILHYVCRQLHRHYSTQLRQHERHVAAWRRYLKKHPDNALRSTPELKSLVRKGVPENLRCRVWSALYRPKVRDLREAKGAEYFQKLCDRGAEAELPESHKRQISLDLLRTMPNNVNFCDRSAEGVMQMERVLTAFCLHNPQLGYCQGMNFLVGMMLLFVGPEDAFWCLVAIVERYFASCYFDQGLVGAQADQELLKELLREKLPAVSAHLAALDIELSTVTLNWFLSVFIDALPIETLLRIWDCFLLEGPKVLFRFSLGILKLQEEAILARHDTVSIMRQLKAAAKLCFDVDGLVSAAFEELEPFPRREALWSRRESFRKVLTERARKKERELQALRERERMYADNVQGRLPKPEVFYVVIGSNPVTCLQLVGRRLWCACGPSVIILSARTLDLLDQFQTSSNGLDYVYRMVSGEQGVWISLRGSSVLQLWDPHSLTCRLLYDVRDNYGTRALKVNEAYTNHARITCVLPLDATCLVGTADGTLLVYEAVARKSPSPSNPSSPRPNPEASGHARQIQERLQKLLIEQQLLEGDGDSKTSRGESPNLTPSSNVSRRESSASSKESGSDPGGEDEEGVGHRRTMPLQVPEAERSPRLYTRTLRKTSFVIATPIVEEKSTKEEGEEEEELKSQDIQNLDAKTETSTAEAEKQPDVPASASESKEATTSLEKSSTQSFDQSTKDSEEDSFISNQSRKNSEPQEFRRFCHVDAGDLVSSEGGDKVVSALEFQGAGLKGSKKRYQSLSAEDIPTWVAQEKPQPVISARGDVTFEYKSRLPSIKAFIRREANELATFLKGQQEGEEEKPEEVPVSKGRNCPLFSIRPPTLDLAEHPFVHRRPDEEKEEDGIAVTEGFVPEDVPKAPCPDSRRSSGIPEGGSTTELLPSYLDEDFLSTAQFNDLLQLQDWTRTSRKGSDTASNVSFGSAEMPFAYELHLKEMIKISDKPIRSLLQASCEDETVVISCAGYYGDDEAVLKWIREGEERLWTNDPIVEVCPFTHAMKPSPYARSRLPRRASIATSALCAPPGDTDPFSMGAHIESGLARVQNLLARVSERTT
ncbi:uncharacterized protein LOC129216802 [Uloborus diversus]|uniref:uncharacterized protein LOC129216802 n=1 Tax=Uloborus diversus TaxID=327109 RepID=UPI00240A5E38|nr:uncharacterized protein LOC129216802 [Uloborus diversus]